MRAASTAWLLAGLCLVPALARAAPAFTATCPDALRKPQIDDLVTRLRAVPDACRPARIDTERARTTITFPNTTAVLLAPRGCLTDPTHEGPDLAAVLPPDLPCPDIRAALESFLAAAHTLAPIVDGDGWHAEAATLADPRLVATVVWILAALLALATLLRTRFEPADRPWLLLALAGLLLALLPRLLVTAAPANWYGAFLPPTGWGDLRFGAGAAVLQAALRAVLPWTADTAFTAFRVLGALTVPLVVLLVRRLGGSLLAAALAAILLALAPIPVRLSASSSEHLLAATLALAAWATWLRTPSDPAWHPRLLALALAALAALTRIDSLPQLALIPVWPLLLGDAPPRRRLRDAACFYLALAIVAVHGYVDIVLPSHHPGPELHGLLQTLKRLLSQFWIVAATPPRWISPVALTLAGLGLLAAAARRQWRWLLATLASLLLIFVPLGRNLVHDGLTGARYFILLAPLLALAPVPLVAWLTARWPARRLALALAPLAALELLVARPAYRHETTFQAEHRHLAAALADPHLADCTLHFVSPRQPVREPDLDCCLAPDRSPLALRYPHLRFAPVDPDRPLPAVPGCQLYYRGAVCSLDPALAPRSPQTAARILAACARLPADAPALLHTEVPLETVTPRSRTAPVITLHLRAPTTDHSF